MTRIILSICLITACAASASGQQVPESQSLDTNELRQTHRLRADESVKKLRAPVRSVTSLQVLPDGTMVRQCDVMSVRAGQSEVLEPRGAWVRSTEEVRP